MFERILIPLDGSEITEMAVPYGEELGIRLGSGLSFIMYMTGETGTRAHASGLS